MTHDSRRTINVLVDANNIITLADSAEMEIFCQLTDYTFHVPREVYEEVKRAPQRNALDLLIAKKCLALLEITDIKELGYRSDFAQRLGKGESACLAVAKKRGWYVSSDEKGRFKATAIQQIGNRIITVQELRTMVKKAK